MQFVVKVTAPEGDVSYLERTDRDGMRGLSRTVAGADVFSTFEGAWDAIDFMRSVVGPAYRFEVVRRPEC